MRAGSHRRGHVNAMCVLAESNTALCTTVSGAHRALEPLWNSCAPSLTPLPIRTTLAPALARPSASFRPIALSHPMSPPSPRDVVVAVVCVSLNLAGTNDFDTPTCCFDGHFASAVHGTAGVPCSNVDGSRKSGTPAVAAVFTVTASPYVPSIATWLQIEMSAYDAPDGSHEGVKVCAEIGTSRKSKTPTPRAVLVLLLMQLLASCTLSSCIASSASLLLLICAARMSAAMMYPLGDGAGSLSRPARASAVAKVGSGHMAPPGSEAVANWAHH